MKEFISWCVNSEMTRFIVTIIITSKMIKLKQQQEEKTFFMHEFIP